LTAGSQSYRNILGVGGLVAWELDFDILVVVGTLKVNGADLLATEDNIEGLSGPGSTEVDSESEDKVTELAATLTGLETEDPRV